MKKENFGSRLGFVLAAAGSAVGLGNIWRFPYLAAKYGGGIFLLTYIILAVTFGFALMVTEISIGRRTGKSVLTAYGAVNKKFGFLGYIAALVPIIIVPYYCVIGGWVTKYFAMFVSSSWKTTAANGGAYFGEFITGLKGSTVFFVIFAGLTAFVVFFGVKKGIELVSKILMPALIVLIVGIAVYTLTQKGAIEGLKYYVLPDFTGFTIEKFIKTLIAAMGQLFYSMSLAMGIMITYGSYMRKDDSIEKSVRQIEVFDTAIAVLAGLIIVPAVFVFSGGAKLDEAGPGLMFSTLPQVFAKMPGGQFVGIAFFFLVILAALTSSISLMETVVALVSEKLKLNRAISCIVTFVIILAFGMVSILGYSSVWENVKILGYQLLDFFDFISNNILMPIVALITCILIGYVAKTKFVEDEVMLGQKKFAVKNMYRVMIMVVCPICMLVILVSQFFISI